MFFYGFGVSFFLFLLFLNFYPIRSLFENAIIENTKIYDRNDILLYETLHPEQGKTTEVPLDQIPKTFIQATIAVEDQNFYEHSGVDIGGIFRAMYLNFREGRVVAGGSTITQQLVRNVMGTWNRRTFLQKIKESFFALRAEHVFTKEEILHFYFSKIYYGNLNYGVAAASEGYFGKHISQLDLAESAFLAGLPQAPNRYDPFEYREDAVKRKNYVLQLMEKRGFITTEEQEEAEKEELAFERNLVKVLAPHFVNYVIEALENQFGESFVSSGLRVRTTLDYHMQSKVQDIARRNLDLLIGRNVTNASVIILDPETAEIITMLGSVNYFDPAIDGEVNIALRRRQPGSAMKPVTYAVAFEKGWNGATVLDDEPVRFFTAEGTPYLPKNYDYEYHGKITVREALANSYNIPAVLAIDFATVEAVLEKAREMGLKTLDESADHYGLALTLGDGEVRLLDLTSAYMVLANYGFKKNPQAILEVRDRDDQIIFEAEKQTGKRVVSEAASFMLTDILSDNLARIPEFGVNNVLEISRPAAVKTGTTRNFRDNWTLGYTPDFVTGVWVGNSDNSPMENISGIYGAGPIWHDVMEEIHRGKPVEAFSIPDSVVKKDSEWVPREPAPLSDASFPNGFAPSELRIKKPFDDDVFEFNPRLDPSVQQIKFSIEKGSEVGEVTWLVNGEEVGRGDEIFWSLQKGEHEIQARGLKNQLSGIIQIFVE